MYSANGIELDSAEFEMLCSLVKSEDPSSLVSELWEKDKARCREVILSLDGYRLVAGRLLDGAYKLDRVTERGRAFLRDYEAAIEAERRAEAEREKSERRRIWSDRRFQIGLSIGTAIASAALSVAASIITNLLMNR